MTQALAQELSGGADTAGMELARRVRRAAHLYETIASQDLRDSDMSGPRFGLLIRLYAEEKRSPGHGISPTHLSQCQRVSKNTISSMLRGLEEQGLIERTLDPDDRRVFRIRLSDAGRELVRTVSPQHFERMNQLASGLTEAEREQLASLLDKLIRSLSAHLEADSSTAPVAV
ncbi:MAG: MarR family transcriptional regulator [Anaerolineae bacterium]|nr:MarR family transcriptional regulator [Anaerolineae bacterium]